MSIYSRLDDSPNLDEKAIQDVSAKARELFSSIQGELGELDDIRDGLSFLDLKNDTLLSYMIDLCNIMLHKIRGESIEGHPSIERCVEYRVILEKLRGIDQKLSYQLNKLITLQEGAEEEQAVNVANLDVNIDDDDSEDDEDNDDDDEDGEEKGGESDEEADDEEVDDSDSDREVKKKKKNKEVELYRPPKLKSVAYEKGGRRRDHSDFYEDRDPDQVQDQRLTEQDIERINYEEDNYTRLSDKKRKKPADKGKGKKKKKARRK